MEQRLKRMTEELAAHFQCAAHISLEITTGPQFGTVIKYWFWIDGHDELCKHLDSWEDLQEHFNHCMNTEQGD